MNVKERLVDEILEEFKERFTCMYSMGDMRHYMYFGEKLMSLVTEMEYYMDGRIPNL